MLRAEKKISGGSFRNETFGWFYDVNEALDTVIGHSHVTHLTSNQQVSTIWCYTSPRQSVSLRTRWRNEYRKQRALGETLAKMMPVTVHCVTAPNTDCSISRNMASGHRSVIDLDPYPIVCCVSIENKNAVLKPSTPITHDTPDSSLPCTAWRAHQRRANKTQLRMNVTR